MWIIQAQWPDESWHDATIYGYPWRELIWPTPKFATLDDAIRTLTRQTYHESLHIRIRNTRTGEIVPGEVLIGEDGNRVGSC